MKKRFFWALCALAMLATPVFAQVEEEETEENDCAIDVYLADNDGPMTNLRDAPRGKVIKQLPNGVYTLCLGENRNGWWKIVDFWDMEEESEDGNPVILDPEKEYWVHYSVVGTGTRNYGGERWCLRAKPSEKSKATYYFKDEITRTARSWTCWRRTRRRC